MRICAGWSKSCWNLWRPRENSIVLHLSLGLAFEGQITTIGMKAVGRVRIFGARRVLKRLRGAWGYKIAGNERQPVGSSGYEPRFTSCEVPSEDASDSQVAS